MVRLSIGKKQLFFSRKNIKVTGSTLTLRKQGSIIIMLDEKKDILKMSFFRMATASPDPVFVFTP